MTDLQLMKMHIEVLYQQTASGKLTVINEPPFEQAPLVFLGVTKDGVIQKYAQQVDDLFEKRLKNIVNNQKDDLLVGVINQISNRVGLHEFTMGPTYLFPKIENSDEDVLLITDENKQLLQADFRFIYSDFTMKQPCVVVLKDDKIVSLCCSARQSNDAAEASVYTMKADRGKGYGAAVTRAWAQQIQQQGKVALYSTTWDNFASQGVARTLGLKQYGIGIVLE